MFFLGLSLNPSFLPGKIACFVQPAFWTPPRQTLQMGLDPPIPKKIKKSSLFKKELRAKKNQWKIWKFVGDTTPPESSPEKMVFADGDEEEEWQSYV